MVFISKFELKKQLQELGVKVEGNYVRKKDLEKITAQPEKKFRFDQLSETAKKKAAQEYVKEYSGPAKCDLNSALEDLEYDEDTLYTKDGDYVGNRLLDD